MKNLILILIFISTVYANELKPVSYVSPIKFSGLWYEIARSYNSFQDKCVASSVEYKLVEPLKYKVFNRCFDSVIGGELIEYSGSAEPSKGESMSSIDMTYFWIFTKKYNVYYLEDNYTYTVIADKEFGEVWIMSREPFIPKKKLNEITQYLSQSMNIEKLIFTPQDKTGRYK